MFKNKVSKGLICLLAVGILASSGLTMSKKPTVSKKLGVSSEQKVEVKKSPRKVKAESKLAKSQEIAKKGTGASGTQEVRMEEYVPKVIIEAKWQKVKEKLEPIEGDPWRGWISCATEIYGEFRVGTISFGFRHQNIEPYPPVMPRSITIDEEENLYILDPANFRVLKFNKKGKFLDAINLERIKPKKGQLGRFEIAEELDIGEESIKIHVAQDRIYIKGLKFSKVGKFIGIGTPRFEEKGYKQLSPSKVMTDNGIVYEIVLGARKEKEKKEIVYKLDPSDERIKNIEGIEWFLKRREEFIKKIEEKGIEKLMEEMYGKEGYPRKDGKITLYVIEGGYKWYDSLKVIKWQKKK
jgi:tetrahydromethanopterin S-methyltransferase subunit G